MHPTFLKQLRGIARVATPKEKIAHREAPWPILRNVLVMFFERQRPHVIRATIEVDVTETLARISALQRETRIALPFHVFAVFCFARGISANPEFNTYRRRDKLITFQDVDILSPLDKRLPGGIRIPVGYIVRGAQDKSLARINWELRQAISSDDLADDPAVRLRRRMATAPNWARRLIARWIVSDPFRLRMSHGTVLVSTVHRRGFARPTSIVGGTLHTVTGFVGAIAERFALDAKGKVSRRKILFLSAACDHDIADGVAMARFGRRLVELFEGGAGLDAEFVSETRRLIAEGRT
ncbi:MAG TPA: 2-oxo acid dehydrogenase subunit E2 [Bradyrhizobium sp.]|nr:2-oxo acid dehydrogenase subunit E2 [Bradyrhizobium sp.]